MSDLMTIPDDFIETPRAITRDDDKKRKGGPRTISVVRNPDGSETVTTLEISAGSSPRAEGPNISYGSPIQIDASNIRNLGLPNDPVTYLMDKAGNFTTFDSSGYSSDSTESCPEEFLAHFGQSGPSSWSVRYEDGANPVVTGHEGASLMLQRVEVGGITQGYFFYRDQPDGQKRGMYLDASAIDWPNLPAAMKARLAQPEHTMEIDPTQSISTLPLANHFRLEPGAP